MKKIIIVNNNMKVGGVQKSLYNLLWTVAEKFDITLCLFQKTGVYTEKLPPSVKVLEVSGPFRYLGMSQGECCGRDAVKRAFLVALCRVLGREKLLKTFRCHHPELFRTYDCAISYLHNGRKNSFYGGSQDFVLHCVKANRKIAFLHGDYRSCGSNNVANNRQLAEFDAVAACSDGCRNALLEILPHLAEKCVTVPNCHLFPEIREKASQSPVSYCDEFVNVITVARLSGEKGIDRAIRAVDNARANGVCLKLHIVGDGAKRKELQELVQLLDLSSQVIFYGEQENPYRFMGRADLLLIPSYHEAAPMVIEEARCLGLPVLTTETTSAHEMVTDPSCGWVCENSQEALNDMLIDVLENRDLLQQKKQELSLHVIDNSRAMAQFHSLMDH